MNEINSKYKGMRKSLNFDFSQRMQGTRDTKRLKEHYLNKNYTNAYEDIKKFLVEHRQGSGYISEKEISDGKVTRIIEKLSNKFNWLKTCCKTFDYYDVGTTFNGLEIMIESKVQKAVDK